MPLSQQLRSPSNNLINVPSDPAVFIFDWVPSQPLMIAQQIKLQVGTDSGFGQGTFTQYDVPNASSGGFEIPLQRGVRYYWRYWNYLIINVPTGFPPRMVPTPYQGYWNGTSLVPGYSPTWSFVTAQANPIVQPQPTPIPPVVMQGQTAPSAGGSTPLEQTKTDFLNLFTTQNILVLVIILVVVWFFFLRN